MLFLPVPDGNVDAIGGQFLEERVHPVGRHSGHRHAIHLQDLVSESQA